MTDEAIIATRRAYEADAFTWAARRADREYWRSRVASFAEKVRASGVSGPVLDLGCGPGVGSAVLEAHGLEVVAFDLTRAMLQEAMGKGGGFAMVQGDSRSLPFASGAFAAVWASASLLHLPKPQAPAALAEVARILQRGGVFYSSMKEGDQDRLDEPGPGSDIRQPRYFAHYRQAEWTALLRSAGFVASEQYIEADPRPGMPDWIVTLAERS